MGIHMIQSKWSDDKLHPPMERSFKASFFLPVCGGIVGVVIAILSMSITVPLWMSEINRLEEEVSAELALIRLKNEASWRELLQIESDDNSVEWARVRRATNDKFSVFGNDPKSDGYYEAINLPETYYLKQYEALKCCCDINAQKPLSFYNTLPVSSKCPVGQKGPPGQHGSLGERGHDGLPGRPGFNYSRQGPHFDTISGFDPAFWYGAGLSRPFLTAISCESCPSGPPGHPGPKGRPGNPGMKGMRGKGGHHGLPGRFGPPGPTGDTGVRGPSGFSGVPGQKGLDGFKATKGPPGPRGQLGNTGIGGIRGPTGPQGNRGLPGSIGIRGRPGHNGQRGMDGIDGPIGSPGKPGSDASYCRCPTRSHTILPPINYFRQSYDRPPAVPLWGSSSSLNEDQSHSYFQKKIKPTFTITPKHVYHQNHGVTKKVHVTNASSFPVLNKTLNQSSVFRPTLPSVSSSDYDEEAFGGKDIFTNTRAKAWSENKTYGIDVAWNNDPRQRQARMRQLYRTHRIV